ncbi:MAG: hypothetical protein L6Q57_06130 [Alphaproteobacteria bacterium]|nr:hypothetical protein [Alphaproteobacteria bacterium]
MTKIPANLDKKAVRQRIQRQLQLLRQHIEAQSPGLLARLQDKIAAGSTTANEQDLRINRKKNLHTVMTFMSIRQDKGQGFDRRLKDLLAQVKI